MIAQLHDKSRLKSDEVESEKAGRPEGDKAGMIEGEKVRRLGG